jgi:hypothetical protein
MLKQSLTVSAQNGSVHESFRNSNFATLKKKDFTLKRRITAPHIQESTGGKLISGPFRHKKSSHFSGLKEKYVVTVCLSKQADVHSANF